MGFKSKRSYAIGQVYFMNFGSDTTSNKQSGWRPGVIFQNNTGNTYSPNVIAMPLTSVLKKLDQPTHVLIHGSDSGLKSDSVVLCENLDVISKKCVGTYITTLSDEYMSQIAAGLLIATSALTFVDPGAIADILSVSTRLNECAACCSL